MSKYKKIIAYILFGLFALAFGIAFIGDLASITDIINLIDNTTQLWSIIVGWVLDLILTLIITIFSILVIVKVSKDGIDENHLFKADCLVMTCYYAVATISSLLLIINAASLGGTINGTAIASLIFLIIGTVLFTLALVNKADDKQTQKLLACLGYFVLFINLIISCASGVSGIQVATTILLFFAVFAGLMQVALTGVDVDKMVNQFASSGTKKNEDVSFSDKLKKLQELYNEGLITEEEYNKKRKDEIDKL